VVKIWSNGCCGSDQRAIGGGTRAAVTIVVSSTFDSDHPNCVFGLWE
jgi:hypothetical protein